jgi:hypothetical protein
MEDDPTLREGGGTDGTRGKPTDPVLLSEEELTFKEIDQGAAYFQLQHMLDTKLMDADRYPLKAEYLVFMNVPKEKVPLSLNWLAAPDYLVPTPQDFPIDVKFYEICGHSDEWADFTGTHMYLDPSGGGKNGDEMAWAVTKFRSGYVYLVDIGGIPGGLHEANQDTIADLVYRFKPNQLDIEDNFGAGTFREVLTPKILKKFEKDDHACAIEGVWESGQKELRIIEALEPLLGGQRLIVDKQLIQKDWNMCSRYGVEDRPTYSLFFQMARLTRERNSLAHDDRLDALAGSCRHWTELLNIDKEKEIARAKNEQYAKLMRDPLGDGSNLGMDQFKPFDTIFDKFRR